MKTEEIRGNWTEPQKLYINFMAALQIDTNGKKWSKEDFAKEVLKMNPDTLYQWQKLPGFDEAVADLAPTKLINKWYPRMIAAQINKAVKKEDTTAFMALARQGKRLERDKSDINQNMSGELGITIQTVDYKNANDNSTV